MLKMEVMIPATPTMDFEFNDSRPMPFLRVPSTPKRFGDYSLSAPSSPSRMAAFYHSFKEESGGVPFDWEEKPGTPKEYGKEQSGEDGFDFAFDLSKELDNESTLSAEELFDGGGDAFDAEGMVLDAPVLDEAAEGVHLEMGKGERAQRWEFK